MRFWILSSLTGLALVLVFPRFELSFLAWFAFVPLFFAVWNQPALKVAAGGFGAGFVFYFFGLNWVTNTLSNYGNIPIVLSYAILALLAAYLAFYVALFCVLTVRFCRGQPVLLFLLAPALWTSLEWLRSTHLEYGFSWLGLGYSQVANPALIQIAEITGIYGVSALIMAVNAALFAALNEGLARGPETPFVRGTGARVLAAALLLFFCAAGYGAVALKRWEAFASGEPAVTVGLAQGNIDQAIKWDPRFQDQVLDTYKNLTLQAAQAKPDLIVWPEAAIPFFYPLDEQGSAVVESIVDRAGTPLLFGSPFKLDGKDGPVLYNSAYLLSPHGNIGGRYDKKHLVPFGEFVPFQNVLWFVQKMVEGVGNFGRGEEMTLFDLDPHRFGVSICFEITFPDLVREPVRRGAHFLVNITNDAWFGNSAASYQHMAMAAMRAVENRVPIVRAANTGVTGTLDPSGRMRQRTELFTEAMVLTGIVPNTGGRTFYSRHGDVFSFLCIGVTVLLLAFFRRLSDTAP